MSAIPIRTEDEPVPALPPARAEILCAAVLTLDELATQLAGLQPPAAYRLSLDSGVGYKNVRRAFVAPMAIRIGTWRRLLRSLRIGLLAVAAAGTCATPATEEPTGEGLRACRLARGWSRRELAQRAGISTDAVAAIEAGAGLSGSLARVCTALGLHLVAALPPHCRSLEQLWEERAAGCLAAPAHYPPARPRCRGVTRGPGRIDAPPGPGRRSGNADTGSSVAAALDRNTALGPGAGGGRYRGVTRP